MAELPLSEKVSVNMNTSTLSTIDLLVEHGYYSNRSDFINQAVRDALQRQDATLQRLVRQHESSKDPWFLGVIKFFTKDIEAFSEPVTITGTGLLVLDRSIPDALLFAKVNAIHVKGRVQCSPSVKAHYGLK